ncbi:MAG: hypothetical protein ACR2JM_08635 [Mycobacterium sp.]
MNRLTRTLRRASTVALTSGVVMAWHAVFPGESAVADACTDIGNHVTVTTCTDLSDVVGELLTPGRVDRELGDLTPNMQSCLGWDGRWVEADSCT